MAEIPKTSVMLLKEISEDSDSARWYDFYNRYHPIMEGYLKSVAAFCLLDADDIIQDTMLALMKILPEYRYAPDEKGYFRNYLIGIVKLTAIAYLKKLNRATKIVDACKADANFADSAEPIIPTEDDEKAMRQLRHEAYEIALAQLMADTRIQERNKCVFQRIAINNESPESVANAYGITRNNVDQIKSRMIARLKELVSNLTDRRFVVLRQEAMYE